PVSCRAPANSSTHWSNGWMVRGYLSGSTSRSTSASGVTHPAQIFTRGKTAASSTRGRRPARASCQAAVLPPGPPPTTMTSCAALMPLASLPHHDGQQAQPVLEGQAQPLDLVGHVHRGEEIALDVDVARHVGLGEVAGG